MAQRSTLKLFGTISASVFLTSALVLSNKKLLCSVDCGAASAGALSAVQLRQLWLSPIVQSTEET